MNIRLEIVRDQEQEAEVTITVAYTTLKKGTIFRSDFGTVPTL